MNRSFDGHRARFLPRLAGWVFGFAGLEGRAKTARFFKVSLVVGPTEWPALRRAGDSVAACRPSAEFGAGAHGTRAAAKKTGNGNKNEKSEPPVSFLQPSGPGRDVNREKD